MKQKRILVLGATGAMGQYLVPLLSRAGFRVDGVSFDGKTMIRMSDSFGRISKTVRRIANCLRTDTTPSSIS